MLSLNKKPKIETIEFALQRKDGKIWEDTALGTNERPEGEKEFIKNKLHWYTGRHYKWKMNLKRPFLVFGDIRAELIFHLSVGVPPTET